MKITLRENPIREVVDGYQDNKEAGIIGFHGKLRLKRRRR
jgi:hypothetical protein